MKIICARNRIILAIMRAFSITEILQQTTIAAVHNFQSLLSDLVKRLYCLIARLESFSAAFWPEFLVQYVSDTITLLESFQNFKEWECYTCTANISQYKLALLLPNKLFWSPKTDNYDEYAQGFTCMRAFNPNQLCHACSGVTFCVRWNLRTRNLMYRSFQRTTWTDPSDHMTWYHVLPAKARDDWIELILY